MNIHGEWPEPGVPELGTRWARIGEGSNIPGVGPGCAGIRVTLDGLDVTGECVHADERLGVVEVHIPTPEGRAQLDIDPTMVAMVELQGKVVIAVADPCDSVRAAMNIRQLLRQNCPGGRQRMDRLDERRANGHSRT